MDQPNPVDTFDEQHPYFHHFVENEAALEAAELPPTLNREELNEMIRRGGVRKSERGSITIITSLNPTTNEPYPLGELTFLKQLPADTFACLLDFQDSSNTTFCLHKNDSENKDEAISTDQSFLKIQTELAKKKIQSIGDIQLRSGRDIKDDGSIENEILFPIIVDYTTRVYRLFPQEADRNNSALNIGHFAVIHLNIQHKLDKNLYTKLLAETFQQIKVNLKFALQSAPRQLS